MCVHKYVGNARTTEHFAIDLEAAKTVQQRFNVNEFRLQTIDWSYKTVKMFGQELISKTRNEFISFSCNKIKSRRQLIPRDTFRQCAHMGKMQTI